VNARAEIDEAGVGGQTPLFHAASQYFDFGLPMVRLLMERGADLDVRARLPGHFERTEEFAECTPFSYARLFPGNENATVELLRAAGAAE
jgi:ankyrin repeat protein